MESKAQRRTPIGRKMRDELQRYALLGAYLYVCFGAVLLYKEAVLRAHGVHFVAYGLAAIKALLIAKFLLVGRLIERKVRIDARLARVRLARTIASKAIFLLFLLVIFSILEEQVVGFLKGRSIDASLAAIGGGNLPEILAASFLLLLILIPYVTFGEISAVLGEGRLRQIFFSARLVTEPAGSKD